MNLYNWNQYNLNESLFNTTIIKKLRDRLSHDSYDSFRTNALKEISEFDLNKISDEDIEIIYPSELKQFIRSNYDEDRMGVFFTFRDDRYIGTYFQRNSPYSSGRIEEGDLVLFVDLTSKSDEDISNIREQRYKAKEGLLKPEEAKQANIERYRKILMDRIGISDKDSMVLNYKALISKIMTKETAFFLIITKHDEFNKLLGCLNKIIKFCNEDDDDVSYTVESAKNYIGSIFDYKNHVLSMVSHNKNALKKHETANFNFEHVLKMSELIFNYAINYDVKTVYDMNNVFYKFNQIYKTYGDSTPTRSIYNMYNRTDSYFAYPMDDNNSDLRYQKFTDAIVQESTEYLTSILR